jgi:hypothetical protein
LPVAKLSFAKTVEAKSRYIQGAHRAGWPVRHHAWRKLRISAIPVATVITPLAGAPTSQLASSQNKLSYGCARIRQRLARVLLHQRSRRRPVALMGDSGRGAPTALTLSLAYPRLRPFDRGAVSFNSERNGAGIGMNRPEPTRSVLFAR